MADFTREEVIQVVEGGRKCVGADLRNIDLNDADLWAANLREANLRDAHLRRARYSANTQWPEGFDPEAAGAEMVEDDD